MTSEIIKAEEGPKRADRKPLTYVKAPCSECGDILYFFKMERHVCCLNCGAWTKKPVNCKALSI